MENKLERFEEEISLNFSQVDDEKALSFFESYGIRYVVDDGTYYYCVVDVIKEITKSADAPNYWTTLKGREKQLPTICRRFKAQAKDGKMRDTEFGDVAAIYRIVMSINSPHAEQFKLRIAALAAMKTEEIIDPELGFERLKEIYRAKGYPDEWIERRLQSIDIRKQLTDEWKNRGVKEGQEYSILTAVIAKGTFGMTPAEHKKYKGLENTKENLRDHMTPLELILTSLSEEVTRTITVNNNAQGFEEAHDAAIKGGELGGRALKDVEKTTGQKVVSKSHFKKTIAAPDDKPPLKE